MRPHAFALATISALLLPGCFMPPSAAQRLADIAQTANVAARFGRMDIALESVSPEDHKEFAKAHAEWGKRIRVVDLEFSGFEMLPNDDAEVTLDVEWQRVDTSDLQVTQLVQRWHDKHGWRIVSEERRSGAPGLLAVDDPDKKKDGDKAAKPKESDGDAAKAKDPASTIHTVD